MQDDRAGTGGRVSRRGFGLALMIVLGVAVVPEVAEAADAIPVKIRVLKGSREGPASIDPRLADLQNQLKNLAYVKWEQVGERDARMEPGKSLDLPLPDGSTLELKVVDSRKDSITFEVKLPARRSQSRLTISKDRRIVHQVAQEKGGGAAYFVSIRAGM